LTMRPGW